MAPDRASIIKKVGAEYLRSFAKWEELDMNVLEEDFEGTLTRKYEEGYSAALGMVLDLLEEESK
jgi:hypothetical protein